MFRSWFFRARTFEALYFGPSAEEVLVGGKWRWAEGYKQLLESRRETADEAVRKAAAVLSRMGGIARAQSLTARQRSNIASKAAQTRWRAK